MSETISIGQTLDGNKNPITNTGIVLKVDSPTAKLLLSQATVIISNPITKEYGAKLQMKNSKGVLVDQGLGIIPPGSIGPPEHIHPAYDETFTVVEGAFDFLMNKKIRTVTQGETVIVPKGTPHTFKPNDKTRISSFLVSADPPGKLQEVIRTIWALAHEGKTDAKGQPNQFWQGIAIGNELREDTLFVSPPPFVQRLLFSLFGNKAAQKGFKGIYDEYLNDDYWINKVKQVDTK